MKKLGEFKYPGLINGWFIYTDGNNGNYYLIESALTRIERLINEPDLYLKIIYEFPKASHIKIVENSFVVYEKNW